MFRGGTSGQFRSWGIRGTDGAEETVEIGGGEGRQLVGGKGEVVSERVGGGRE